MRAQQQQKNNLSTVTHYMVNNGHDSQSPPPRALERYTEMPTGQTAIRPAARRSPAPPLLLLLILTALLLMIAVFGVTATATPVASGTAPHAVLPTSRAEREALVATLRYDIVRRGSSSDSGRPGSETGETEAATTTATVASTTITIHKTTTVPDPPRSLGIHTACLKFGRGCPDEYIRFLQSFLATLPDDVATTSHPSPSSSPSPSLLSKPPPEPPQPDAYRPLPFPIADDWSMEEIGRLEDLQRYIAVLEARVAREAAATVAGGGRSCSGLHRVISPDMFLPSPSPSSSEAPASPAPSPLSLAEFRVHYPSKSHCNGHWLRTLAARLLSAIHPVLALALRQLLLWRLLPCSLAVACGAWAYAGSPWTNEEAAFVESVLAEGKEDEGSERGTPTTATSADGSDVTNSRAAVVVPSAEGVGGAVVTAAAAAVASEAPYHAGQPRPRPLLRLQRRRRAVAAYVLLDAHRQLARPLLLLRLRVLMCGCVCCLLVGALFALCWHSLALLSPSSSPTPASTTPSSSRLHYSSLVSGGVGLASRVSLRLRRWVLPDAHVALISFALGLSFIGSVLVAAAKGLVDAHADLTREEAAVAAQRGKLLHEAM